MAAPPPPPPPPPPPLLPRVMFRCWHAVFGVRPGVVWLFVSTGWRVCRSPYEIQGWQRFVVFS